jgi:hypothetical protein
MFIVGPRVSGGSTSATWQLHPGSIRVDRSHRTRYHQCRTRNAVGGHKWRKLVQKFESAEGPERKDQDMSKSAKGQASPPRRLHEVNGTPNGLKLL